MNITVHLVGKVIRIKHKNLTVDFDETFEKALEEIKAIFIDKLEKVEVFFSVKIRFLENDSEIDFYPKIKEGLIQMNKFINSIKENFPCNCSECRKLSELVESIFIKTCEKDISFIRDYAYEINKELIVGETGQLYVGFEKSDIMPIPDMRTPLKSFLNLGKTEGNLDEEANIFDVLRHFIVMHIICFQQQNHSIMPVFMIIFKDDTYSLMPFIASIKSTFYRKINEISDRPDFDEVTAVLYCGEYYTYPNSPEDIQKLINTPYSERIKRATSEVLYFNMLLRQCGEWSVGFDENKIDDMEYVSKQLQNLRKIEQSEPHSLDLFFPIKEKMGLYTGQRSTKLKLFVPPENSECLCGSGIKFTHCCADNLPGFYICEKTQVAIKDADYKAALIAARSDVAQYTIWHKTNTAPLEHTRDDTLLSKFERMLKIDVEALSEYVNHLSWCYDCLNLTSEFPAVLEKLRSNIDHPRWHRKMTYHRALHSFIKNKDREAGKNELRKLEPMDGETDVEVLQLYADLFHNELGFSKQQALVERIISLVENPAERLHYQCQSALNLLMENDCEEAAKRLQSAINAYTQVRDEDSESSYALYCYASAVELLGNIQKDKTLLNNAVSMFKKYVTLDNLTNEGITQAYFKLGNALYSASAWQEAKGAYSAAFENTPYDILKVHISKCLLCLDDFKSAIRILDDVDTAALSDNEITDYVFIFAQLAIESQDRERLVKADQALRSLKIIGPYFKRQQDALQTSVVDMLRESR